MKTGSVSRSVLDEVQAVSLASLGALVHVAQDLRDRRPFAFIGAGLPHLPSYIAKAATYTERFRYEQTDNLNEREARAAVLEPAAVEAVSWDDDALSKVVAVASGYPYFLQLYAFEAWEAAARAGAIQKITLEDVQAAEPVAQRQVEAGIDGARFQGATSLSASTCSQCRISWRPKATEYVPEMSPGPQA